MKWPLDSQSKTHLILECPLCHNRLRFKALPLDKQLIWSCESCNHVIDLQLVPLQTHRQMSGKAIYH